MTTFLADLGQDLARQVLPPSTFPASPHPTTQSQTQSQSKQDLRSLFLSLEPPSSLQDARECLATLQQLEADENALTRTADKEEVTLRRAILGKLVVGLYVQALDTFLQEASSAESELEWWSDVGRSRWSTALYLLQTLPPRVANVSKTILITLRSQNLPLHPSSLTPSSLRRLFPTSNILRPNALTISLFPYLKYQPYTITLATSQGSKLSRSQTLRENAESALHAILFTITNAIRDLTTIIAFPFILARNECRYKQSELEKVRNERAEVLGVLTEMRSELVAALQETSNEEGLTKLAYFAARLQSAVRGDIASGDGTSQNLPNPNQGVLQPLYALAYTTLPAHVSFHTAHLNTHALRRPSRLILLWPKSVFLPPLALYAAKTLYASRYDLHDMAKEAYWTLRGFWEGWVLGPLKDIVRTVRTTDEDGVIITKESVKADLDSLERMTLALAKEKLNYGPEQLDALARQIRLGDLTPVMQIYEDDIKSPLRSAIGGTLLRTLFVQVQKAKVDIDQALSGIDKLLKSQELTFAFVGVAPALAIVYGVGSYLHTLWRGGRGSGLYGGKKKRTRVWLAMRRIERLLISQPKSKHRHAHTHQVQSPSTIEPLTAGLLLLSLTHLREYAATSLPVNSRLREGFLEDVADLENPDLGRTEKMRVVDRMWRNWGDVLGWRRIAGDYGSISPV
ncbi:NCA2-domain-containing protein [Panus rudis PR-1116 ss-1]|nr:NCA2-domain-containing protein [Panus rudis PR-1116 ss-1]